MIDNYSNRISSTSMTMTPAPPIKSLVVLLVVALLVVALNIVTSISTSESVSTVEAFQAIRTIPRTRTSSLPQLQPHDLHPHYYAACEFSSKSPPSSTTSTSTSLFGMFGNIFGGGSSSSNTDDKNAVLAEFLLGSSESSSSDTSRNIDVQYESLMDYITNEWSNLFVQGTIKLTTPVTVVPVHDLETIKDNDDDDTDNVSVEKVGGVKFIFHKSESKYKKWDDDNRSGTKSDGENGNETQKKTNDDKKQVSEGAVTVRVEQLASSSPSPSSSLRIRAVRSDIDDDTIIKEMSEEKIVEELKEAVAVWKKQHQIQVQ